MARGISVVLNTLNEESNLPWALRSVQGWADEILVVDMESNDATREVARSFGARVLRYERSPVVDAARAFAVERARFPWILLLDADEMVPVALRARLEMVAEADEADVVNVPRLNYVFGKPLQGGGWGSSQDRIPRFFKGSSIEVTDRIHSFLHPRAGSRIIDLPARSEMALAHFAYHDVRQFVEKLNRYTDVEALQAGSDEAGSALRRGAVEFLRRYVRHGGFRDGWRGAYLAAAMGFYHATVIAKVREGEAARRSGSVEQRYQGVREAILHAAKDELPVQDARK